MPTATRYLSKSLPAAPTNGIPDKSSFSPGASPMNMTSAWGLPTPNTTFVLVSARLHLWQPSHSFLISSRLLVSTCHSSALPWLLTIYYHKRRKKSTVFAKNYFDKFIARREWRRHHCGRREHSARLCTKEPREKAALCRIRL